MNCSEIAFLGSTDWQSQSRSLQNLWHCALLLRLWWRDALNIDRLVAASASAAAALFFSEKRGTMLSPRNLSCFAEEKPDKRELINTKHSWINRRACWSSNVKQNCGFFRFYLREDIFLWRWLKWHTWEMDKPQPDLGEQIFSFCFSCFTYKKENYIESR